MLDLSRELSVVLDLAEEEEALQARALEAEAAWEERAQHQLATTLAHYEGELQGQFAQEWARHTEQLAVAERRL